MKKALFVSVCAVILSFVYLAMTPKAHSQIQTCQYPNHCIK